MENQNPEDFLKDLPLTAEEVGFKANEMVVCEQCRRANAPNRRKCLYCGAKLTLSAEQSAAITSDLRKLENWENGYNLIYLPRGEIFKVEALAQIGRVIGMSEFSPLSKILELRIPLPIARVESAGKAEILRDRLKELGLQSFVISDETLSADVQPKRLRGLEFRDDQVLLILFNNDEIKGVRAADLSIIVSGAIFQKAVESIEERRKGEKKILDATETASDEVLIDLYTKQDSGGFRILTKGFDFSCLGAEKGILARDNMKKLIAGLRCAAPQAKLTDDYPHIRNLLGEVWEVEQRRDSQGLTRQRFGKFDLSSVASSNNLQQFTKYSRLQRHLL